MNPVSDGLLFTMAEISATLIGLLLVGVFFYVETGFRRLEAIRERARPFLRATTRLTLLLYSLVLGVAVGLVALRGPWLTALYALLSAAVAVAVIEWARRYQELRRAMPLPRDTPRWIVPGVLLMLAAPWAAGGLSPSREAFAATLLAAGALAFMSTLNLLLTSFDLAALERTAQSRLESPEEPAPIGVRRRSPRPPRARAGRG